MKFFRRIPTAAAVLVAAVALVVAGAPLPAEASIAQAKVVSENPDDTTPQIVLGTSSQTVYGFAQIGSMMFAGGRFTQAQNAAGTVTYQRQNFFAFDASTGAVSAMNHPFGGTVETLVPSTDGNALFIGGDFKSVDGVARPSLIKYDLVNHRVDPAFNAAIGSGIVSDAKLVNGRLIVAGTMPGSLLALSPTTGANTGYINAAIAGTPNTGDVTKVLHFDVDPAGGRLVALGNFDTVNGQSRKWGFELTLGSTTSALNTWHAGRLDVVCDSRTPLNLAQDVDFSPDGAYFVIVTTGGPSGTAGLCDATARYSSADTSNPAPVTWINFTGGDSLYSVIATGSAVYVGGHARWLDNPDGYDSKGPGAVDRPGIGAIDPVTGKANSWNPTKDRNHGVQGMLATSSGLWVGSDGQKFFGENHAGIAFCPLPK